MHTHIHTYMHGILVCCIPSRLKRAVSSQISCTCTKHALAKLLGLMTASRTSAKSSLKDSHSGFTQGSSNHSNYSILSI